MIRRIYIHLPTLLPGLLLSAAGILSTPVIGSDKAWNTNPQSGYFSGPNWSGGTTGGNGEEVLVQQDSLYFDTSRRAMLTNDLPEWTFENVTFNEAASAYTIYGNRFVLIDGVTNCSTSTQTINNDIVLTSTTQEIEVAAGGEVVLGGILSGTDRGLYMYGPGRLTLSRANTYTGPTFVAKGTLALGPAGSIAKSTNVTVESGAVLDVSAVSGGFHVATGQTLGGRGTITGPVTVDAGGALKVSGGSGTPVLQVNGGLTLGGTTLLSIGQSQMPAADRIQLNGDNTTTLKFGGTLVLANSGAAANGSIYTLFSAPKFSGRFTALVLKNWNNWDLRVDISQLREGGDGTIKVLYGNQAPKTTNIVIAVEKNGAVSFELAKYAPDPDGDLVTPTFYNLPDGDQVTLSNGVVTYRPAFGATGTRVFNYQVTDPSGKSSEDPPGEVTATITSPTGSGGNILSLSGKAPAPITISFAGIPGGIYQGQFSDNLAAGTWTDVGAPVTVGGNGKGSFVHADPPLPGPGFYRTRWVGGGAATE